MFGERGSLLGEKVHGLTDIPRIFMASLRIEKDIVGVARVTLSELANTRLELLRTTKLSQNQTIALMGPVKAFFLLRKKLFAQTRLNFPCTSSTRSSIAVS